MPPPGPMGGGPGPMGGGHGGMGMGMPPHFDPHSQGHMGGPHGGMPGIEQKQKTKC